jgi:uncharacterized glyoxalase superfamily protein PhnB
MAGIPRGFHTVTPYLASSEPRKLLDFLVRGLGATLTIAPGESETDFHAEVRIGDSMVMIGNVPANIRETVGAFYLYVPDADALYRRAVAAGAAPVEEPSDRVWGDRMCSVRDPFGNAWMLATCKEDRRPAT